MYMHMGCTNWIQRVKKVNKIIKKGHEVVEEIRSGSLVWRWKWGMDIVKILFIHTFYTYMNFLYTWKFQRINKINFKKFQNLHNVYTCDILRGLKVIFFLTKMLKYSLSSSFRLPSSLVSLVLYHSHSWLSSTQGQDFERTTYLFTSLTISLSVK